MLNKNDRIFLEIHDITHEGDGVGRYEQMAVFVPMTAVGDKLWVTVVKVLSHYAYGIISEIVEPSPHRIPVDCAVYSQCGGCGLRHMSYEQELVVKQGWAVGNLKRIGGIEIQWEDIAPSPKEHRYRNKAQFPVSMINGQPKSGFFAKRSHRLVPVSDCMLQPAYFSEIADCVMEFMVKYKIPAYDEATCTGTVRHLYIRAGEKTGDVMVCLVINEKELPHGKDLLAMLLVVCPKLTTFVLNINERKTNVICGLTQKVLYGNGTIADEIAGVSVMLSPLSFYQVNTLAADALYAIAKEFVEPKPTDVLVDIYCGIGTIGLSMAKSVAKVIGVEIAPGAVADAKISAKKNNITNAQFMMGDASTVSAKLASDKLRANVVILDPPRKGLEGNTIAGVVALNPERIVYISCNCATQARDCKALLQHGYKVTRARAVDLFPRTVHVESVVLLEKI